MDQHSPPLAAWCDRLAGFGLSGFLAALVLTTLVFHLWGGSIVVQAGVGTLWGGTILFLR